MKGMVRNGRKKKKTRGEKWPVTKWEEGGEVLS
jgi:hypothetical protein